MTTAPVPTAELTPSRCFKQRRAPLSGPLLFLVLCCTLHLGINSTLAQNYSHDPTHCLTDAEGLFLKWNSRWQSDGKDLDQIYKIERSTRLPSKSGEHFVLELRALKKATLPYRRLSVKEGRILAGFCQNLSHSLSKLSHEQSVKKSITQRKLSNRVSARNSEKRMETGLTRSISERSEMRFIEYRDGKWVRGDLPIRREITSCTILGKKFACLKRDKKMHEAELLELEAKIAAMEGLEY